MRCWKRASIGDPYQIYTMIRNLLTTLLLISTISLNAQEYNITDYGVITDSTQLNTAIIQKVIDKAYSSGGGTIVIPKGVYLTGALFFKPKTKLKLLQGAVLKGSDNIADYPLMPSRMEGQSLDYYAALINAYKVNNFSIRGPGEINGNGLKFWKQFWSHRDSLKKINKTSTNLEVHRPRLLFIWGCNNVTISNVQLHNSGFWTTHLYQCRKVLIDSCDIRSPFQPVPAPSTDGVDIDVCKQVTIRNTYISVNDDAICIKGGKGPDAHKLPQNGMVEDILIENCSIGSAHATLTLGSESIHARNITMRNCTVDNKCPVLKLKMRPDTYQIFENINIYNITGTCGTIININPWKQFFDLRGSQEKPFGIVKHIRLSNINVTCDSLGDIDGNPSDQISDITFNDMKILAKKPVLNNKYKGVNLTNVKVNDHQFSSATKI